MLVLAWRIEETYQGLCGLLPGSGLQGLLKQGRVTGLHLVMRGAGQSQFLFCQPSPAHQRDSLAVKRWGRGTCGHFSSNPNLHLHFSLTGAISLSYKFTITPDGEPWCKIQGQINGNEFLDYNCNSQKNATEVWERQTKTLKGLMEELKKNLLNIKPEIIKIIGKFARPMVGVEHRGRVREQLHLCKY